MFDELRHRIDHQFSLSFTSIASFQRSFVVAVPAEQKFGDDQNRTEIERRTFQRRNGTIRENSGNFIDSVVIFSDRRELSAETNRRFIFFNVERREKQTFISNCFADAFRSIELVESRFRSEFTARSNANSPFSNAFTLDAERNATISHVEQKFSSNDFSTNFRAPNDFSSDEFNFSADRDARFSRRFDAADNEQHRFFSFGTRQFERLRIFEQHSLRLFAQRTNLSQKQKKQLFFGRTAIEQRKSTGQTFGPETSTRRTEIRIGRDQKLSSQRSKWKFVQRKENFVLKNEISFFFDFQIFRAILNTAVLSTRSTTTKISSNVKSNNSNDELSQLKRNWCFRLVRKNKLSDENKTKIDFLFSFFNLPICLHWFRQSAAQHEQSNEWPKRLTDSWEKKTNKWRRSLSITVLLSADNFELAVESSSIIEIF